MSDDFLSSQYQRKAYFNSFGLFSIVTNTWFFNFVMDLRGSKIRHKLIKTPNCVSDSSKVCGKQFARLADTTGYSLLWEIIMCMKVDFTLIFLLMTVGNLIITQSDQESKLFIDEINKPNIEYAKAEFHLISSMVLFTFGFYFKCIRIHYRGKILAKVRSGLLTLTLEKQLGLSL